MASLVVELAGTGRCWNAVLVPDVGGEDPLLRDSLRAAADVFGPLPAVPLYDPRLPAVLVKRVTELKIDLVHSHLSTANIASRAAATCAGRPHMATIHTMPGPAAEDTALRSFVDGWSSWLSKLLVAPSRQIADAYHDAYRLPRGRLRVVPNAPRVHAPPPGFDRDRLRDELGGPGAETLVVVLARLQPEKGIGDLIDAMAQVAGGVRVAIAGAGPAEQDLRDRIAAAGLGGRVRLLGHRSDVGALLAAADVFCLPSRHEGLPLSLLEAMRVGLPSVATRVGGIPAVVEDGVTGLLVAPADPDSLARALTALATDPATAGRIGAAGREIVTREFDLEAVADAYAGLYEELLAG